MIRGLAILFTTLAAPALGQEFVTLDAVPDDETFYRAVACAAPPDGACNKPFLRWPEAKRDGLGVGLVSITPRLVGSEQRLYDSALDAAIGQINGAGSGIRLVRDDVTPDIAVHIVPSPPYHPIRGSGIAILEGAPLELGRVMLRSRDARILEGVIAISAFARPPEIAPVILEEVTQALGLMTDLRGPGTLDSVFGEDTNAVTELSLQDQMALTRHYPR